MDFTDPDLERIPEPPLPYTVLLILEVEVVS
jgi:hypothetical protein